MEYIKIITDDGLELLQEVQNGVVIRYCSILDGTTISLIGGSRVLECDYQPSWVVQPVQVTPEIPEPLPVSTDMRITKLAFRNRFTSEEKIKLELSSIDDPSASIEIRQMQAAIRVYMKDLDSATWVDMSSTNTITGLNQLELMGLINHGRATEIINGPIQEWERLSV